MAERLASTRQRIRSAAESAGRAENEITLVVVTKNHPAQLAIDLFALGERDFGENRDQEVAPKALEVAEAVGSAEIAGYEWHFVGQLQTNKVRSVLQYASKIHSLDRDSLLKELCKGIVQRQEQMPSYELGVFIQLNLTDDPGRGGIAPHQLREFAEKTQGKSGLNVLGVMGVASLDGPAEKDFESIAQASGLLQQIVPTAKFISAGMSEDFELAIGFGATHLRIGTAITGKRLQTP